MKFGIRRLGLSVGCTFILVSGKRLGGRWECSILDFLSISSVNAYAERDSFLTLEEWQVNPDQLACKVRDFFPRIQFCSWPS
jgi:hypothetical protein